MSSKKLHDKTNKIRRGDDDIGKLQMRYYHISIDKLGDAFEKQFMQNLPDFGQYALDPNLSQEEIKNKNKIYGIKENKKNEKVGSLLQVKSKKQQKVQPSGIFGQANQTTDFKVDEEEKKIE